MKNLNEYLKYYFLEEYLFKEVSVNFQKNGYLTAEEFFAIIIWKSNRNKTGIRKSVKNLIGKNMTIRKITESIDSDKKDIDRVKRLTGIKGVGISIASAILTVCYPNNFTIADYRAKNSLKNFFGQKEENIDYSTPEAYLNYASICINLAKNNKIKLRNFDRILWGMDFYEGFGGLKELTKDL